VKKWFLIIIAVVSGLTLYAGEPERVDTLSTKVILQNTNGYFVFSDGSCWKAVGFSKRWRSLSEWWNGVQLVPKNYECLPNDWYVGTQIEVYSKYGNLEVDEANASNQEELKQCTHLLFNTRTGQVLFAIALHPADCMVQLFKEAYDEGYGKGFDQGRMESYKNATEIYNRGHTDGYKLGYTEGFKAAHNGDQPQS